MSLTANTATFTDLPDIPLTSLAVTLDGGPGGLFLAECGTPSGIATAELSDENGDRSLSLPAAFTVSGCPASPGTGAGVPAGIGSNPGGTGATDAGGTIRSATSSATLTGTRLLAETIHGLRSGAIRLGFRVSVARGSPALTRLTVTLPRGLAIRVVSQRGHRTIRGVSLHGASARSLRLVDHRLVITVRRPTRAVRVTLEAPALRESRSLRSRAHRGTLPRLALRVAVQDARRHTRTISVTARP